jgi:hypothetical protein
VTAQEKQTEPGKGASDFVDLITGKIGKITALVTAIGGLVVAILTNAAPMVKLLSAVGLYTPAPCVQVEPLMVPTTVKYSEWDNMRIKLKGRSNCSTPFGLYVTFVPRSASEARFVLRLPHEDLPECKGGGAPQDPKCWDPRKPVSKGKGDWECEIPPPPLARLSDPRSIENISVTYYVYDYDAPTKPAIRVGSATIKVESDGGNPP